MSMRSLQRSSWLLRSICQQLARAYGSISETLDDSALSSLSRALAAGEPQGLIGSGGTDRRRPLERNANKMDSGASQCHGQARHNWQLQGGVGPARGRSSAALEYSHIWRARLQISRRG